MECALNSYKYILFQAPEILLKMDIFYKEALKKSEVNRNKIRNQLQRHRHLDILKGTLI